jgi:hypothetical protein
MRKLIMNRIYPKGRRKFVRGDIKWKSDDGDTIKCFLIEENKYTPNFDTDEFLSDIPDDAKWGSNGYSSVESAPTLTIYDLDDGVCDADDVTFNVVTAGKHISALVFFKDTGDPSTSPLLLYLDEGLNFPITTNGANLTFAWDNGPKRMFRI